MLLCLWRLLRKNVSHNFLWFLLVLVALGVVPWFVDTSLNICLSLQVTLLCDCVFSIQLTLNLGNLHLNILRNYNSNTCIYKWGHHLRFYGDPKFWRTLCSSLEPPSGIYGTVFIPLVHPTNNARDLWLNKPTNQISA